MTDIRHDHDNEHPLPDAMRWELRALRRDVEPSTDLWPSIARRIAAAPRQASVRTAPRAPRYVVPFAIAASLALAIGFAWQLRPAPGAPGTDPRPDPHHQLIAREADAMTLEYQGALKVLSTAAPSRNTAVAPELRVLDRSAAQIRTALRRDPDARFLLDRLQRTYTRRLELTQRIAQTTLAT